MHQTAEADSRVILDTYVTTGARHDNQPYLGQLQRIEERYQVTIGEVTADRGYGSAHIIRTLQEQGKRTFIPLWSGRVGNSKYLKGALVYQKEDDRFRCPAGKYLTPTPAIIENHKRYVSLSAECQACARASSCPARTRGSSPQRFVLRNLDQDLFEEVQARMRDPAFGEKLSERMWKMEGLFAEAKQNHGLSRARYRGRSKVQIQAYLIAIVQNLKRLVAALWYWRILAPLATSEPALPHPRLFPKRRLFQQAQPISDALAHPGNSPVFRHAVLRAGFPCVLAESGLRRRERAKCPPAEGENRTFFLNQFRSALRPNTARGYPEKTCVPFAFPSCARSPEAKTRPKIRSPTSRRSQRSRIRPRGEVGCREK